MFFPISTLCHIPLRKKTENEIDLFHLLGEYRVFLTLQEKISVKHMLFAFLQKYITGKKRILYNFANHIFY